MPGIDEQDAAYKRGLVLGLTLAEIVLLVLFVILLVIAALFRVKEKELEDLKAQNRELAKEVMEANSRIQVLQEQVDTFLRVADDPEQLEQLFRELTLAKQQAARVEELEATLAEMSQQNETLQGQAHVGQALARQGVTAHTDKERERLAEAVATMVASVDNGSGPVEALEQSTRVCREHGARIGALEGQVKNIQTRCTGTQWPACWAERETGRTEYIFDVALSEAGIMVRDRQLPHRAEEQATLPLAGMQFGQALSPAQFLDKTRALFEWSESRNCRFFVRAYDQTAAEQKELYKDRMRTVEQHFYKLEIRDERY